MSENISNIVRPELPERGSQIAQTLHHNISSYLNIALAFARLLFSAALLYSITDSDDFQLATIDWIALLPFGWAVLAIMLALAGQFRWKTGGRLMVIADMVVSVAVIVTFPAYTLSALALMVLSTTFLVLRREGGFGMLLLCLPLTAMLVRPLGILNLLGILWPVSHVNISAAGGIVAFLLASTATLFCIGIIIHIRMIERPLSFQQPWEEEFLVGVGKHNIAVVINQIQSAYPASKLICLLDDPNRREGKVIITDSSISRSDIEPIRSQLTDYPDHGIQPIIVELGDHIQIDVRSGRQSPIPDSMKKMARGLVGLGFNNGVLFDFKLGGIRGRLFFKTGTPLGEALRGDMIMLTGQLEKFFGDATKWEKRRKEMMGSARDLARRDLHDGILQSLAALKIRLVTIVSAPNFSSDPDIEALRKSIDIVTVEQTRLRALLHNDEADDDSINLVDAIEVCLKTLSLQWEVSVTLASQEPALPVDRQSAENIEFLVREAITNAIRHAGSKRLIFAMALSGGNLILTLKDDLNASDIELSSYQAARKILESRSLSQRLRIVNGYADTKGLEDSTLLIIRIPMDFTEND